ncbi:hypothetical protein ILUMI_04670 [Ignelater luminosus]|uniref:Mutator-like transposase domain-containing protein n=1 Tax=Ignelater luminosus TaxID=2038154 RepID=A0A8K0DE13_IGNLU|nr:hypothetical protein ILUMI_04670 [Ignelater luminosus]
MCNIENTFATEPDTDVVHVNKAAVCGTLAIGAGYSHLTELCSSLNIPSIAQRKSKSNTADMPCNSNSEVSKIENAANMLPVQEPENMDGIDAEIDDNGSENLSELEVVTDTINEEPLFAPTGRRLFDIGFLFQQILKSERHTPFDYSIIDMSVISESRHGLQSTFLLKCKNCGIIKRISNENVHHEDRLDINLSITLAVVSTGVGYSQIEKIAASIDMPMMSDTTYQKFHESVSVTIHETAWKIMEKAERMEAELAKELEEKPRIDNKDAGNDYGPNAAETDISKEEWHLRSKEF